MHDLTQSIYMGGSNMIASSKPSAPAPVSCDVCLKEIPKSEAQSAEVQDYVLYFCGLECYQQWSQQREDEKPSTDSRKRGNSNRPVP